MEYENLSLLQKDTMNLFKEHSLNVIYLKIHIKCYDIAGGIGTTLIFDKFDPTMRSLASLNARVNDK